MSHPWLASILQTTDPLFPIGSYAHSYGLEEWVREGFVKDQEDLFRYLDTIVRLNLQEFELPYLRFALDALALSDFEEICRLDDEIGAAKLSLELRTASATQGQQRLRLLGKLRPSSTFSQLANLKSDKQIVPHHLIVFAAEMRDLATPLEVALSTWSYQAFAAACAASLKLFRIGQEGSQTALTRAIESIDPIIKNSLSIERSEAGACLPSLDIASHRHEHAFSRLFIS